MKEYLSRKGVTYKEYDVAHDQAAAQFLLNKTGELSVPVIFVDGEKIVGFDESRLDQLINMKRFSRPSLGASIANAGNMQNTVISFGAYIGNVKSGSLAERVGLKPGDIIIEVNKQNIVKTGDIESVLSRVKPGSKILLVYLRGDRAISAEGVI